MGQSFTFYRIVFITLGNAGAITISAVAACMRIFGSKWLSWGGLAVMLCVIASVNALSFLLTWFTPLKSKKETNVAIRVSEINLTMYSTLYNTMLAGMAFYIYDSHKVEADLVKEVLPAYVENFTSFSELAAWTRITIFSFALLLVNLHLFQYWFANGFKVYRVMMSPEFQAEHGRKGFFDQLDNTRTSHKKGTRSKYDPVAEVDA